MKSLITFLLVMSLSLAASPFFDSSVYIVGTKANIRNAPGLQSDVLFQAEYRQAFKYLDVIEVGDTKWYKLEFYNKTKYDIYYKVRSKYSVSGKNFQRMLDLYEKPDIVSNKITILPTKRNIAYDNKPAPSREWVRMRLMRPQIGYVAASLAKMINRPYFLVEIALESIAKHNYWSYKTKNNILNGDITRYMTKAMIWAIKGEPDSVQKDKSGRNLYETWWYGSQAVNFRNGRATSW